MPAMWPQLVFAQRHLNRCAHSPSVAFKRFLTRRAAMTLMKFFTRAFDWKAATR